MAVTVQQLLYDAKKLVSRLRDHGNEADVLVSRAHTLNNNLEIMKEYHKEIEQLNGLAHQRPRSALILNIQQENRHIRALQQENKELRAMLEEHQSVLDMIMNKYRQQVMKMQLSLVAEEKAWHQRDKTVEIEKRSDKVSEMTAIVQKAIEIDDEHYKKQSDKLQKLLNENNLLRDMLEIQYDACQVTLADKLHIERIDECVQTEL